MRARLSVARKKSVVVEMCVLSGYPLVVTIFFFFCKTDLSAKLSLFLSFSCASTLEGGEISILIVLERTIVVEWAPPRERGKKINTSLPVGGLFARSLTSQERKSKRVNGKPFLFTIAQASKLYQTHQRLKPFFCQNPPDEFSSNKKMRVLRSPKRSVLEVTGAGAQRRRARFERKGRGRDSAGWLESVRRA